MKYLCKFLSKKSLYKEKQSQCANIPFTLLSTHLKSSGYLNRGFEFGFGLDWIWIKIGWIWIEIGIVLDWIDMDRICLDWNGLHLIGLDWNELEFE